MSIPTIFPKNFKTICSATELGVAEALKQPHDNVTRRLTKIVKAVFFFIYHTNYNWWTSNIYCDVLISEQLVPKKRFLSDSNKLTIDFSMLKKSTLMNAIGFITCTLGLFFPWCEQLLIPGVMTKSRYMLGIQLIAGQFTLASLAVSAICHVCYVVKRWMHFLIFTAFVDVITVTFPTIWIMNPGIFAPSGPYIYNVLYGAYVSLVGGMFNFLGTLFSLYTLRWAKRHDELLFLLKLQFRVSMRQTNY